MKVGITSKALIMASIAAIGLMSGVGAANASSNIQPELFGVHVKGATRDELRAAIAKAGLKMKQGSLAGVRNCDAYEVSGQMKGATELDVCYYGNPNQSQTFANANYTFPSLMDVGQVVRVKDMVASKYGAPDGVKGNANVGPVTFVWGAADKTLVGVYRGWPNTTTTLMITDIALNQKLLDQINEAKAKKQAEENKKQSNAF